MPQWSARRLLRFLSLAVLACLPALDAVAADRIKPTRPTPLRSTAVTPNSVSLAWSPSTDNSGSFSYLLLEVGSGQTRTVPQTQTSTTWTGLQPGQSYRFVAYARDAAGNQSLPSNAVTVGTPLPPMTAPVNLRIGATGYFSITLDWDPVPGGTQYQVSIDGWYHPGSAAPTYTFAGLNPNRAYLLGVRVIGPQASPWSQWVTASTLNDPVAPSAPVLAGGATSPGVVRLSWTAAFDDVSGVGYNVYVNGAPARSMLPVQHQARTVDIFNLHAATAYDFSVRAYDAGGNLSAPVPALRLVTPAGNDTTPPEAPVQLQVVPNRGNGISSVGLSWLGGVDDRATRAYEIHMDGVPFAENVVDVHYGSLDNFHTVRLLQPGSTHVFVVKARDEAGNVSLSSNAVTVTLAPSADVTPPTAPVLHFGSTSPGCGFLDFNWSGATDDVDAPAQLEFEIYEDDRLLGVWRGEVFEGSFGRHRYHLRAVDRAGNRSAPSNSIELDSGLAC